MCDGMAHMAGSTVSRVARDARKRSFDNFVIDVSLLMSSVSCHTATQWSPPCEPYLTTAKRLTTSLEVDVFNSHEQGVDRQYLSQ